MRSQPTRRKKDNLEERDTINVRRKLYLETHCFQGENTASIKTKRQAFKTTRKQKSAFGK